MHKFWHLKNLNQNVNQRYNPASSIFSKNFPFISRFETHSNQSHIFQLESMGVGNGVSPLLHSCIFVMFFVCLHVQSVPVERSSYIVHMDKSLMPKTFTTHHNWYKSTLNSLKFANPASLDSHQSGPSLLYTYSEVVHGFSALLSVDELEALKRSPGFVSAYSDKALKPHTTHTPDFLSLSPDTGLWPAADYGQDVVIGVVDSGIWPESKSFSDHGVAVGPPPGWKGICEGGLDFSPSMCNNKLIGARTFDKGARAANPGLKRTSPRDINGHGTHCASIAAGNFVENVSYFGYAEGTARGVAPLAKLAVYQVFFVNEGRYSDVVAGFDQAIIDGVDVISMSNGEEAPLYENPIAIASFAAMEKGVVVSVSAGNSGPSRGTVENGIPWLVTVAAGTVDRWFAGTLTLGNGLTILGWTMFPVNALVRGETLVYDKALSPCNSTDLFSSGIPYGIVICDDIGDVSMQIETISQTNLVGAIFVSDDPELGYVPCPAVVIGSKDAPTLIKYATTGNQPVATLTFQQTLLGRKPAPGTAHYSSRGPSRSCPGVLKPDIMAPGSLVVGAYVPTNLAAQISVNLWQSADYNILSGTSMACPHISGVAALLKGAHPEWSPAAIRSAMMTTANPLDNTLAPIKDFGHNSEFASPLAMGSGQVDPNRALDPGLVYDTTPQEYVNLLCSMNFTRNQILTITRSHLYNCSNPSADLNYPSFISEYNKKSPQIMYRNFHRTVTNVGQGAASYKARVVLPVGCGVVVSPETLVFEKTYEKQSYTLSIAYVKDEEMKMEAYGEVVWEEQNGKRSVRSPIVVSPELNF